VAKYRAKPVEVEAKRITRLLESQTGGFSLINLELEGGVSFAATREMCARMTPKVGDYVVTQEDGYVYLNPKDVFERKYEAAE
jgi:hypothetical protein